MKMRLGVGSLLALGLAGPADANHLLPRPIEGCTTIERPGSYRLTRTLRTGEVDCIVIASDFVTIDLGGFAMIGPGSGAPDGNAITGPRETALRPRGVVVRNGTIRGYIRALHLGPGATIQDMRIIENDTGLDVQHGCTLVGNTFSGNVIPLRAGDHCTVRDNRVSGIDGFAIGSGSTVTGNRTNGNEAGLEVGAYSTVSGNVATSGFTALRVQRGSTVMGNTATGDGGMEVDAGSTVANNTVSNGLSDGIEVQCPSNVIGNTAVGNENNNLQLIGEGCNDTDNVAPPAGP